MFFGNRGKNMSEDINESMRRKVFVARMIPIESDTFYMDNDTYFYFDTTGFIEYSWVQGDFLMKQY